MKILYVTPAYPPAYEFGGPVRSVPGAAKSLTNLGHYVEVFTTDWSGSMPLSVPINQSILVDGIPVTYFQRSEPIKDWFPKVNYLSESVGWMYSPRMRHQLRKVVGSFDIVHTHLPFVYPTYAAGKAALREGVPLVYSQRGVLDPERLKFRSVKKRIYLSAVELPLLRKADLLVALSEREVSNYRKLGLSTRCAVVPNGINRPSGEAIDKHEVSRSLERFGLNRSSKYILFLGRLHVIKGIHFLIRAFAQAADNTGQWNLVVAGPDEQNIAGELIELGRSLGLGESLKFCGMVDGKEKLALQQSAKFLCLPSVGEGQPMAVLESLSFGVPVVVSPQCGLEIVAARKAGFVVPLRGPEWVDCLKRLMTSEDLLQKLGSSAIELAAREFSWPAIAERLESEYYTVLKRAGVSVGSDWKRTGAR